MLHSILLQCPWQMLLFYLGSTRSEKFTTFSKIFDGQNGGSSDLLKHFIYYADDIVIATNKSLSHHIEIIDNVLECYEKSNMKIKAQKMSIAQPEVEFLGIV
jgi:hypothetical protein